MISNSLKVGDYIFTPRGSLARVTKINKNTYTYELLCGNDSDWWSRNIPFSGIRHGIEWFECTDIQAKALENAFKTWMISKSQETMLNKNKELLGKAKYFLEQLKDIKEVDPEEDRY